MDKKLKRRIAAIICLLFLLTITPAHDLDVQEVEEFNFDYGLIYKVAQSFS